MFDYIIYTAASANDKTYIGGCSAIIYKGSDISDIARKYNNTTAVRMSIMGVIAGLELMPDERRLIEIHTNSQYILDAINKKWPMSWEKKNWHKTIVGYQSIMEEYNGLPFAREGDPIKHADLWKRVLPHIKKHTIKAVMERPPFSEEMKDAMFLAKEISAESAETYEDQDYIANSL